MLTPLSPPLQTRSLPLNYAELLAQVKSNGYTEKYQGRGTKIILPGIGFSSNEKMVIGQEECDR